RQRNPVLVEEWVGGVSRMRPRGSLRLARQPLRIVVLVPSDLKLVDPEISEIRIQIPPKPMTVHVLGKDISLEDRALHGHPLPGIHGHPDGKRTHRVTETTFGDIC